MGCSSFEGVPCAWLLHCRTNQTSCQTRCASGLCCAAELSTDPENGLNGLSLFWTEAHAHIGRTSRSRAAVPRSAYRPELVLPARRRRRAVPDGAREFPAGRPSPPSGSRRPAHGWTHRDLAEIMGCPVQVVDGIVQGTQRITPEIALRLAEAFGTSPELWVRPEANRRRGRVLSNSINP